MEPRPHLKNVSSRRVFVTLPISDTLQKAVVEWREKQKKLPVRWLSGKNLHVTIIPPWAEEEVVWPASVLRGIEGTVGKFDVNFTRVRFGPNSREPRLIWAEGESPDQIFALKHGAERALGKTPETRPFRLHLTLARFASEEFKKFPVKEFDVRVSWKEHFASFALFESHLSPGGAEYEILETFAL